MATLELKGASNRNLDAIMPGRNKSPVDQAWHYAIGAPGVKWVLVSNYVELRLYGFGEGNVVYEVFALDRLVEPEEYGRFMLLLSADNLLSGRTLKLLKESRSADRDISEKLCLDYKAVRLQLIDVIGQADVKIDRLAAINIAQKISTASCLSLLPKTRGFYQGTYSRMPIRSGIVSTRHPHGIISKHCSGPSTRAARI